MVERRPWPLRTCWVSDTWARPERTGAGVKLVTYDDGKVGHLAGEEIVRLDVPTMREYFERGGADETGK